MRKLRKLIAAALEGALACVMPTDYEASGKPKQAGGCDYTVPGSECSLCNPDSPDTGLLCASCTDKAAGYDELTDRMRYAMRDIRRTRDRCDARVEIAKTRNDIYEQYTQETVSLVLTGILATHFGDEIADEVVAKTLLDEWQQEADAATMHPPLAGPLATEVSP